MILKVILCTTNFAIHILHTGSLLFVRPQTVRAKYLLTDIGLDGSHHITPALRPY